MTRCITNYLEIFSGNSNKENFDKYNFDGED